MKKLIFILLLIAGAFWHFSTKNSAQKPVSESAPVVTTVSKGSSSTVQASQPSEVECKSVGGHLDPELGCITGSHEPTADQCKSFGGHIVEGLGCVTSQTEVEMQPTDEQCKSLGGHLEAGIGCVTEQ